MSRAHVIALPAEMVPAAGTRATESDATNSPFLVTVCITVYDPRLLSSHRDSERLKQGDMVRWSAVRQVRQDGSLDQVRGLLRNGEHWRSLHTSRNMSHPTRHTQSRKKGERRKEGTENESDGRGLNISHRSSLPACPNLDIRKQPTVHGKYKHPSGGTKIA